MIKTFRPALASISLISLFLSVFPNSFAEDEIKEPPSYGSVIETQTTNQTAPAPSANPNDKAATAGSPATSSTQSKMLTSTISLGQTQCPPQTSALVMGVVGASNQQRSEVVCVPQDGYQSTPHYLAHYAFEKLGGGFSIRAVDHVQVMLVRKSYETVKPDKKSKKRKEKKGEEATTQEAQGQDIQAQDNQTNSSAQPANTINPAATAPKVVYKPEIYRFSTDWPRFFGFGANKQNQKLLAATNNGDIQALYVTVDGVSDSAIFGIFNQAVSALGPNAGTLGLAAVGLIQAGK